jgi:hypothetical protein
MSRPRRVSVTSASSGFSAATAVIHHGNTASTPWPAALGFTPLREDTVLGRPCTVYALSQDDFAA